MEISPPVVVSTPPDCDFYRTAEDAAEGGFSSSSLLFDSLGQRLEVSGGRLRVAPGEPDGADDLARVLRRWLGHMDALRESTANWSLDLLVRAAVVHLGYSPRK